MSLYSETIKDSSINAIARILLLPLSMVIIDFYLKLFNPEVAILLRLTLSLIIISVLSLALNVFELNKLKKIIKHGK